MDDRFLNTFPFIQSEGFKVSYLTMQMDKDREMFRVGCACGDSDCDLYFFVDEDEYSRWMGIAGTVKSVVEDYENEKKTEEWKRKVERGLENGSLELSAFLMIRDREHIDSIIEVLKTLREKM